MKKDNKFKITKAELQQIIKEEYATMASENARAQEIKERLAQINEELETLPETLSEVEATGTKKVKSTGWTGYGKGDVKYGEKFEKIGTHLKEDDEIEGEMELGGEEEGEGAGYFEMKFAELGKELDEKMSGSENMGDEMEDEIEVEVEDEMGDDSEGDVEEVEVEDMVNEDLEEPIEGETPAQDSDARFNDYMEKDTHVNESVKKGTSLLSEGFTPERKTALDGELERMRALAKIGK